MYTPEMILNMKVLCAAVVLTLDLVNRATGATGPVCYNCDLQPDGLCQTTIQCDIDQVCSISDAVGADGRHRLMSSQCMGAASCQRVSIALMGRRRTIYNHQYCFYCCDQDLCNASCTGPASSTATIGQVPTQPVIGSTRAPCKDVLAPETCLQVQQFVCKNITMATTAGCLHTCKFC